LNPNLQSSLGYLTPELLLPWVLAVAHFYRLQS
jgi:hypothetical protein